MNKFKIFFTNKKCHVGKLACQIVASHVSNSHLTFRHIKKTINYPSIFFKKNNNFFFSFFFAKSYFFCVIIILEICTRRVFQSYSEINRDNIFAIFSWIVSFSASNLFSTQWPRFSCPKSNPLWHWRRKIFGIFLVQLRPGPNRTFLVWSEDIHKPAVWLESTCWSFDYAEVLIPEILQYKKNNK